MNVVLVYPLQPNMNILINDIAQNVNISENYLDNWIHQSYLYYVAELALVERNINLI